MSKKEYTINIDPKKLVVNFGLPKDPEKDEKLIELFVRAHKKEIPVYYAEVPIEKIQPFCDFKPNRESLDKIKDRYLQYLLEGEPQLLHVYQENDVFIMSDDYYAYFTYAEADFINVPCLIFGETTETNLKNKQLVDWSM